MGRFADVIRCHILEKYMASYMRERNVDALLVLRNENKWAMTGKYFHNFAYNYISLYFPSLIALLLSVTFLWCFLF